MLSSQQGFGILVVEDLKYIDTEMVMILVNPEIKKTLSNLVDGWAPIVLHVAIAHDVILVCLRLIIAVQAQMLDRIQ